MTDPVAIVKADVAKVETAAVAWYTKQWAWAKANWPHLVTWFGIWGSSVLAVLKNL